MKKQFYEYFEGSDRFVEPFSGMGTSFKRVWLEGDYINYVVNSQMMYTIKYFEKWSTLPRRVDDEVITELRNNRDSDASRLVLPYAYMYDYDRTIAYKQLQVILNNKHVAVHNLYYQLLPYKHTDFVFLDITQAGNIDAEILLQWLLEQDFNWALYNHGNDETYDYYLGRVTHENGGNCLWTG